MASLEGAASGAAAGSAIGPWGALIGGAIGGLFGGKKKKSPSQQWYEQNSAQMLSWLKEQGMSSVENPYGLGEAKTGMLASAYQGSDAAFEAANKNIKQNMAGTGLSFGGGTAVAQQYLAGQDYASQTFQNVSAIEYQDFQAKESQINRGLNIMGALSNKSLGFAQLNSADYFKQLQSEDQFGQSIGALSNEYYNQNLMQKWYEQQQQGSQYSTGQGGNYWDPGPGGNYGESDSGYQNEYVDENPYGF